MSKKMSYEEFLGKAINYHGDKYVYSDKTKEFFNGSHSLIPIICPKHGEFWQHARMHFKYGCKKCSYEGRGLKLNNVKFIARAKEVHGDKYGYSKVEYEDAKSKVIIICPFHGEFLQKPNDHLSGRGCPKCNDSKLERELSKFLREKEISYERQKHFPWLGRQEVDFFLPQYNVAIECQGKQHIGLGGWSNSYDFNKAYNLDERKNKLCFENNVRLFYYCEKTFYKVFLNFKIYTEDNIFYDLDNLHKKVELMEC